MISDDAADDVGNRYTRYSTRYKLVGNFKGVLLKYLYSVAG